MKNYAFLQKKYLAPTYINRGATFISGEGVYLIDQNGERYLDMMSNYGVNLFGYGNEAITKALRGQLEALTTLHCSFNNDQRAQAASNLVQRCTRGLSQVYFGNSGTEAIEAALKFAVLSTGRKKFVAMRKGYHGKTLGALSATAAKKYRKDFQPLLWDFEHVEFNNLRALKEALDDQVAAVILEPIQGEGGITPADEDYLLEVRQLCDEYDALLIIDEIQSGLGRTGAFLATPENVYPDILALGKGLAGGVPVGATLINEKVARAISKGIHSSTFGGNPLACAGIAATLNQLDEGLFSHVQEVCTSFMEGLQGIANDYDLILDVRGRGLMLGVELNSDSHFRDNVLKEFQKRKILVIPAGENVVRFLPPLVIQQSHLNQVTSAFREILENV